MSWGRAVVAGRDHVRPLVPRATNGGFRREPSFDWSAPVRGRLARAHADSVDGAEPNEVIVVWLVVIHSLEIVNISMNVGLRGFFG